MISSGTFFLLSAIYIAVSLFTGDDYQQFFATVAFISFCTAFVLRELEKR